MQEGGYGKATYRQWPRGLICTRRGLKHCGVRALLHVDVHVCALCVCARGL